MIDQSHAKLRSTLRFLIALMAYSLCCVAFGQEVVEPDDLSRFDAMIADSYAAHVQTAQDSPGELETQMRLGIVYLANGSLSLADRVFSICIELDKNSAQSHYYRALTRYEQAKYQLAITDLNRAVQLDPNHLPLRWRLGFWQLEDGRFESAETSFQELLRRDPESLAGGIGVASIQLQRREYRAAANTLNALLDRGETEPYIHHLLASAYRGLRDFDAALRSGVVAAGQPPSFEDPWKARVTRAQTGYKASLERSVQLMHRRAYDESLSTLDELRSWFQNDPTILNHYFYVYSKMEDHARARDVLLEAIEIDDQHVASHVNLSLAFERLNETTKAIHHADRGIEIEPRFGPALLQRARLALMANDLDAGSDYLRRAIECGIHAPDQRLMYGRVLAIMARWNEAATAFQQVAQQHPGNAQAWAGLGRALTELGRLEPAGIAVRRARDLDPQDEFVRQSYAVWLNARGEPPPR